LCVIFRLLDKFRRCHYHLLGIEDMLVVAVGLIALASMLVMSTAVSAGVKARQGSFHTDRTSEIRVKIYVSSVLFTIVASLSKMPLVLWLRHIELRTVYKACTTSTGCAVISYMIASTACVTFQCQLPSPWDAQMGNCLFLQSFWTITISIDIVLDFVLIVLPVTAVMSVGFQQRTEIWAASVLALRTLSIALSLIRLVLLQQSVPNSSNLTLESIPYIIATHCQTTVAAVLSCTLALPCLATVVRTCPRQASITLSKHWSGTSFNSNTSHNSSSPQPTTIIRAPLLAIQASMATPVDSPSISTLSLPSPLGKKFLKAPARPPPPSEHDRPDMSMFIRTPTVKKPPLVTLLDRDGNNTFRSTGHKPSCLSREPLRVSKHVQFDV
ncbi:hypothetical protein EJ07DRAFT_130065, partial [Lizonia empirigonia]